MRALSCLSLVLVIIGALNWGLWGFFQFDVVAWLFGGNTTWLSRLIYSVIGLAGLWSLGRFGKKMCCRGGCSCGCKCCSQDKSTSCCSQGKSGVCSGCGSKNCTCNKNKM